MKWREFLDTAQRLAKGASEGDWRSAVSRAYYAIFHFFRDWLRVRGIDLGKGGQAHSNLCFGLNNCGVAIVSTIAGNVDDLRTARTDADYDLRLVIDQATTQGILVDAQRIVSDFQSLLRTVSAQQVVDGAKQHLMSIGRIPKSP